MDDLRLSCFSILISKLTHMAVLEFVQFQVLKNFNPFIFLENLKHYHPSRVLTLVYQPFAFGTIAILAYNEAKIDTRWRNIRGYALFFISTVLLIVVSNSRCFLN